MRTAIRTKAKTNQQIAEVKTLPAPIGGWNARDALAVMPPTDAVALDNFMPKASYVELRGGYIGHVTSGAVDVLTEGGSDLTTEGGDFLATEDTASTILGNVKTLAIYNPPTGLNKMFAMTNQGVYDVSTAGPAGSSLIARTDGKHQWTMFGDGTSNWLIACNGVDKPLYYDGTTWTEVDAGTSPAITGLPGNDTTILIGVTIFKGRVLFVPKNSLSFWYLPPAVAGGAALEFDLSSQTKRGGYLMAIGVWTRDAGDGQDDVAVFVTSEGDAIVYQGDNPSQANSWNKVGTFYVGKPLGRRCLMQYGGDLVVLTENGAFAISAALQSAIINYEEALSNKIEKAFTEAGRTYGGIFGWEATIFPAQQALIVNIPLAEDGQHYQYVMNTLTKAWCRFLNWNVETFAVFNRELYFAMGNGVYKAWTGQIDNQDNIEGYGKQAFSYFGSQQLKRFTLFRPMLSVNGPLAFLQGMDVDFQDQDLLGVLQTAPAVQQALWDVAQWDTAFWSGKLDTIKEWTTTAQWPGFCAAGKIKVATNSLTVQWMSSDYIFEPGAIY